ncbi:MAG: LysM peptidoglycan-binding domain-containing protein [Bacteroidetes bacterium]|nr:LysM peptidoglycan-binding domain-containing protein [Bacteroidota bacterium]
MKRTILLLLLFTGIVSGFLLAQETLQQLRSSVTKKINGKEYYIHSVKKGQTLYMIGKAYDVDVKDIIQENPEVKEGLKAGMQLKIPTGKSEEPPKKQSKKNQEEAKKQPKPVTEEQLPCGKDRSTMKPVYNVALLIPLYLGEVEQMDVDGGQASSVQEYRSLQFIQFYEGFRMALDSLKENGVSLNVHVYDADRDTAKTAKLLQKPELKDMDLIIGLMFQRNFHMLADFGAKNNITIVNPISERDSIVIGNPRIFKVRPSVKTQFSEMIKFIETSYSDSNVIVISDYQRNNKATATSIMTELEDKKIEAHLAEGYGEVLSLLTSKKGNIIILISNNRSYVLDVVTKLNEHRTEFSMTLLGLPRWDRFDDIEADYLVNLNTHVMAPYFIDYNDPGVKKFVAQFQERYKTDPDPLAFQGFDVTYYFMTALYRYGRSFGHCIPELRMKSLQTDFRFSSSGKENGYENQYWEMYEFDNYRLQRILLK